MLSHFDADSSRTPYYECMFPFYPKLLVLLGADGEVLVEAKRYCEVIVTGAIGTVTAQGALENDRNMDGIADDSSVDAWNLLILE